MWVVREGLRGAAAAALFDGVCQMITSTIILYYYYLGDEGSPSRHLTLLLVIYGLAALRLAIFLFLV
jgi:hypothetical protein